MVGERFEHDVHAGWHDAVLQPPGDDLLRVARSGRSPLGLAVAGAPRPDGACAPCVGERCRCRDVVSSRPSPAAIRRQASMARRPPHTHPRRRRGTDRHDTYEDERRSVCRGARFLPRRADACQGDRRPGCSVTSLGCRLTGTRRTSRHAARTRRVSPIPRHKPRTHYTLTDIIRRHDGRDQCRMYPVRSGMLVISRRCRRAQPSCGSVTRSSARLFMQYR